ncbi:AmpG family muropeptide MFS transporter [Methyloceanibacter sp.]|uniref:AmpG family muropeptide MFS transporter n=1 Tax=Methyloceanibacter sp. TaxID=1965321 RepID=UPI002D4806A4|nr:MFS transporter [Methyloceanibacter sp.]HZP07892.1 MFS transporter [Methyloceanibacter sp.]
MTAGEGTAAKPSFGERIARAAAVFLDPRVLIILLLGFSSGLPLALSASTLLLWMKDVGVDLKTIGLFSLVGVPYTIKFLWAPIVDAFQIPILGRLLGHRRGWLVFSQLLLMATIVFLGFQNPLANPWMVALAAVIVATASATQDIVIDAFRVEYLPTENQAAGMAYFVAAYRVGMLISTAGAVALVAYFEHVGVDKSLVWAYGYAVMAALVVIGMVAALLAKEPRAKEREAEAEALGEREGNPLFRFFRAAYAAFADFFSKKDALLILLFVVLYKLTDTFAGVMTGPFVLDIGFDKASYAAIVKGVGFAALLIGGVAGGVLARAMPLSRALLVAGVLQAVANFTFSWLAWLGTNHLGLAVAISTENFTSAIGTVVFIAYLSALCSSPAHTATQFALLTALASFGRTTLASITGYVAESVGWIAFFALCAAAAIPGLLLLWLLTARGDFAEIEAKERAANSG